MGEGRRCGSMQRWGGGAVVVYRDGEEGVVVYRDGEDELW